MLFLSTIVWRWGERHIFGVAQEVSERSLYSGNVSRFRDLYWPEQFQGASCLSIRFLHASFPRSPSRQRRKSTRRPCRQSPKTQKVMGGAVFPMFESVLFVWTAGRRPVSVPHNRFDTMNNDIQLLLSVLFMRRFSQKTTRPSVNSILSHVNTYSLLKV